MSLFKRKKQGKELKFWYYLFYVNGKRYSGSTGAANRRDAERIEHRKHVAAEQGDPLKPPKPKVVREFIGEFQQWVKTISRKPKTISDYLNGCRLILASPIAGIRLDHVTEDDIEATAFHTSPYSTNCARRTLRRALHRAVRINLIRKAPTIKLLDAPSRDRMLTRRTSAGFSRQSSMPPLCAGTRRAQHRRFQTFS